MNNALSSLIKDLHNLSNPVKAEVHQRFFKTGKGEYGEGDVFIGLTMPQMRKINKKYKKLDLKSVQHLLKSKIHEERLVALLIMVSQYEKGVKEEREETVQIYLKNTKYINNWDLVDLSAPKIIGAYLLHKKDRSLLNKLALSKLLWEKRISMVSTYTLIKAGQLDDTIKIAEMLLKDKHDLIHKATGWMLREVGKQDIYLLEEFLEKYMDKMPRTALRYSIERMSREKRDYYLGRK